MGSEPHVHHRLAQLLGGMSVYKANHSAYFLSVLEIAVIKEKLHYRKFVC